jgi:hypothetical protein
VEFRGYTERSSNLSAGFESEPEIGRANLLVSRIMMFATIHRINGLISEDYEKRLTGRFALPNRKIRGI